MKKYFVVVCLAVLGTLFSCQQGPEVVDAKQLAALSDLATVEYTVSKVVKATDDANILAIFGTRKIIFNTSSTLKAGFDMSGMTDDDIKVDASSKEIEITLPRPKLLSLTMRPEDIKLVYCESSGLRGTFTVEERSVLLAQGEAGVRNSVASLGILDDAMTNGAAFFEAFLKQCGYKTVKINFKQK